MIIDFNPSLGFEPWTCAVEARYIIIQPLDFVMNPVGNSVAIVLRKSPEDSVGSGCVVNVLEAPETCKSSAGRMRPSC
ncbi:hypothetical protein TNCV_4883671 [Trichonephila clavipes]|nr:hypothetical protein TNCV_4883671 [Trichonephila clavipes]